MANTAIDIEFGNVFDMNFFDSKKRIVVNRGGTRSGKTYSIMQMFAKWLITGEIREGQIIEKGIASVVRKTFPSLRRSAMRDFEEILNDWGLYGRVQHLKSENLYKYKGRTVEFFSADNEEKLKGSKRAILYCNESNELDYKKEFFQLLIRTTDLILVDLNPSDPYTWVKTVLEDKRQYVQKDVDVIVSNYKDNPFLPDELVREIEAIDDPDFINVYVRGEYGTIKGVIFEKFNIVDSFPKECKKVAIGLDFGYTNDPTAIYKCGVIGKDLFIHEIAYEYAMDNDLIGSVLPRNIEIFCDSAEPKSIDYIRKKYKVWTKAVKKGADSVRYGIDLLKQYRLNFVSGSEGIIKEQKLYKWATIKGTPINKPIDNFNHAWDAVRYYAISKLSGNRGIVAY